MDEKKLTDEAVNATVKSLKWVCNQIPNDLGNSNEEKMLKCIRLYCEQGIAVINRQKAEIERLKNAYREGLEQGKFDSQVKIAELQKQVDELTELKTVKIVDGNGLCVTFYHKNKEVGAASVCDYQGREDNFLHGVEVKEQYRGQGYGRMIVEYMTTHYPVDTLYVEKANNTAIRLYERFGFALTCDTFDKDGKTMAVMARGQELYKQAVKDTAKEICDLILECWEKKQFVECDWLRVAISEKYGVEVD